MQTRQWHLFLILVVGLPLKLHSSQGLFFPKTAILMLRERFLIAENTCEIFFRASRGQIGASRLCATWWAVPLLLCRCRPCAKCLHGFQTFAYLISRPCRFREAPPAGSSCRTRSRNTQCSNATEIDCTVNLRCARESGTEIDRDLPTSVLPQW